MLLLLLWLVIEVTEAIEELKKLLETIKNSKYASCNSYIINVILFTCYFHTMQIRQEQAGGVDVNGGVDVDGGMDVDGGVEEEETEEGGDTITILFLNSSYIYIYTCIYCTFHLLFYHLLVNHLFIHSCLKVVQGKPYKFSLQTSTLRTGKYPNTGLYHKRERFTGLNISAKH